MDRNRDCDLTEIQSVDLELEGVADAIQSPDGEETTVRTRDVTETVDAQEPLQHDCQTPPPPQQEQLASENHAPVRTRHSSTGNTTLSGSRTTQQNQSSNQRRQRPRDEHLISEPPPPYPGPPSSSCFAPMTTGVPPYDRVTSTAPVPSVNALQSQPVYVLSPYGQVSGIIPILPGQLQYSTVAHQPRSTEGRNSESFPTVAATVIAPPQATQQTSRLRVRGHPATDYMGLSYAMVALCAFQGNILALACALPALAFSIKPAAVSVQHQESMPNPMLKELQRSFNKAQEYNERRNFEKAKSCGRSALICNALALLEYVLLIIGVAVTLVLIFLLGVV